MQHCKEKGVRVLISSHVEKSSLMSAIQSIRFLLHRYGILCHMGLTTKMGGVRWRREMYADMRQCQVMIPFVTASWCRCEENILELYYALRHSTVHGFPLILPIIFEDVLRAIEEKDFWAAKVLRDHFFHIPFVQPIQQVVDKVYQFLQTLDLGTKELTIGHGADYADVYLNHLQHLGGKQINSGLASVLSKLSELSEIDLSNNYLGNVGVQALCPVIEMKPNLTHINLKGNGVTNVGITSLVNTLVAHPGITSIDLSYNNISKAAAAELSWLIDRNERICEMNLEGTGIGVVWMKRIQSKLKQNSGLPLAACHTEMAAHLEAYRDDISLTEDSLPTDVHKWVIIVTVVPQDQQKVPKNIKITASITFKMPNNITLHHTLEYADPDQGGNPILEAIRQYLMSLDARTIVVSRRVGLTLKLVLENVGEGIEHIQHLLRSQFVQEHAMTDQGMLDRLYHVVDVRLLYQAQPDSLKGSFFVEGMVAYNADERVAKKLVKLYREDITRCKGSLCEEVQWLASRVSRMELLEDADMHLLELLEEQEVEQEQARQASMLEDVVTYWKCTPAVFNRRITATLHDAFQKAAGKSTTGPTEETGGGTPISHQGYVEACLARTDFPPYAY